MCGKGTISRWLARDFGFRVLSIGEVLKSYAKLNDSELDKTLNQGKLANDKVVFSLIRNEIQSSPGALCLDGLPRRLSQALLLDRHLGTLAPRLRIFCLDVPDAELRSRVSQRLIHPGSGRIYHLTYNPPRMTGIDDVTGEPLVRRADDSNETFERRLSEYHNALHDIKGYYMGSNGSRLCVVKGADSTILYREIEQHLLTAQASESAHILRG